MKSFSFIVSLLLAFVCTNSQLHATTLLSPPDTLDRYVIDDRIVERFDGSQLEGKKIVSYKIDLVGLSGHGLLRVHDIRTEDAPKSDPAYVVDGKQVSREQFEQLNPEAIKSISVIKNGNRDYVKQYVGWEKGVILVETKKDGTPVFSTDKSKALKVRVKDDPVISIKGERME